MNDLLEQEEVLETRSHCKTATKDFSQSETVGFNGEALEQADMAEPRRGTRAGFARKLFGEVRTPLAVT